MSKRYTTLGTDVLDTSNYNIIAEAKTNELAQEIADKMNEAATIAQLREVATAAREVIDGQPLGDTAPDGFIANFRIQLGAIRKLAAALAALEQETK